MENKNRKRFLLIAGCCIFICTLILMSIAIIQKNKMHDVLPDCSVIRSGRGLNINFTDKINNDYARVYQKTDYISKTIDNFEDNFSKEIRVNVFLTEETFDDIVKLKFIKGNFFSNNSGKEKNKYIVIDEAVAVNQFFTTDVIGEKIFFNNTVYTICGVVESVKGLFSELSNNGYGNVYASVYSLDDSLTVPVNLVYATQNASNFTHLLSNELSKLTGKMLFEDSVTNYYELKQLSDFVGSLVIFLLGFVLIITLLIILIKECKNLRAAYKLNEYNVKLRRKTLIYNLLMIFFTISIIALIYILVKFGAYIPLSILPKNNLFDFPHYYNLFITAIQRRNSYPLVDFYWNFSFISMCSYMLNCALSFICGTLSMLLLYKGVFNKIRK